MMNASDDSEAIRVLSSDCPMREQALRLIFSGEPHADSGVDQRIRAMADIVAAQGMNSDLLVATFRAGQPTEACLAIESPGRSAIVYVGPVCTTAAGPKFSVRLLRELQNQAWQRDIALLQAMVSPDETHLERLFAEAGFRFLAELIYLDRVREMPVPSPRNLPQLELITYSQRHHDLFLCGLEQTYTETLDCAGLSGARRTEDVLASHRATGRHDPSLWFLARIAGEPAGVLLLSPLRNRNVLEIVYIGVAHRFRRRGVGRALMHKCSDETRARNVDGVTVAVDSVNTPARMLYRNWGFAESGRRRAWIAVRPS